MSRLSKSTKLTPIVRIVCRSISGHSNYGPSSYVSERKKTISVGKRKFVTRHVFTVPAEGVPLEFCNGGRVHITRMMPLPDGKKTSGDICIRLDNNIAT